MRITGTYPIFAALALALSAGASQAQTYPARSVQMLLGFSAGGSVDLMARGVAEEMSSLLGQRLVVVNREGASGVVAMTAVANAAPDGYLLGVGPATPVTNVPHVQSLPYKIDSFEYVCQTFRNPFTVAVRADSPYQSLDQLLQAAKRSPGKLSYGHAGHASIPHLAAVDLLQKAGAAALDVPFKGDAAMLPALLGGQVDFGIPSVLSAAGQKDRLRVLHVFPPPHQGLNGIYAPRGTPAPILKMLEEACEKAVKSPKLAELARRYHSEPAYLGAAEFARVVADDYRLKGELIKTLPLRK
jgi:tripartite-type tricarboxylate transporter receptor subunit TctC